MHVYYWLNYNKRMKTEGEYNKPVSNTTDVITITSLFVTEVIKNITVGRVSHLTSHFSLVIPLFTKNGMVPPPASFSSLFVAIHLLLTKSAFIIWKNWLVDCYVVTVICQICEALMTNFESHIPLSKDFNSPWRLFPLIHTVQ